MFEKQIITVEQAVAMKDQYISEGYSETEIKDMFEETFALPAPEGSMNGTSKPGMLKTMAPFVAAFAAGYIGTLLMEKALFKILLSEVKKELGDIKAQELLDAYNSFSRVPFANNTESLESMKKIVSEYKETMASQNKKIPLKIRVLLFGNKILN